MKIRPTFPRVAALAAAGALGLGAVAWTSGLEAQEPAAETAPIAIPELVERVSPAVVTVLAEQRAPRQGRQAQGNPFEGTPFEDFFDQFRGPDGRSPFGRPTPPGGRRGVGLGSGFVLESDGYIVTNHHVIDGASEVAVRFTDGREFDAEIIGSDPETDVALLKIDETGLPHVSLGDSDTLRVGEEVVAVGNPFGLGGTVTTGIVSALARDIRAGAYVDFIQTDAAINRGNSGGPLFDRDGDVMGVNTAIFSPSGGSVGVGFAIPSNIVETVVADLKEDGSVERGWLGVMIQPVTPEIAEAMELDAAEGALVADVVADSPAEGALRPGDVIRAFNGEPVETSRVLPRLVAAAEAGSEATLEIVRGGERETVTVEIGERETENTVAARTGEAPEGGAAKLGATLGPLTERARAELGLAPDVEGAVVTSLQQGGPAAEAGMQVGDVILRVGGTKVASPDEAIAELRDTGGRSVLIQIARGDARLFVGVPLA